MNAATLSATLRTLIVFGQLRSDVELEAARTALRGRNVASYARGLRRLLASGTLAPKQVAVVVEVLA